MTGHRNHQELLNPFAFRDGELHHVSVVTKDDRHGYTCPRCSQPLVAKLGHRKQHHFAHLVQTNCLGGLETALHLEAKKVFERYNAFWVPEYSAAYRGRSKHVSNAGVVRYVDVHTEERTGDIRPDVCLSRESRPPLLVEVVVTHRVGSEKLDRLRDLGYPCLEIDVRSALTPTSYSRKRLQELLIESDSLDAKRWVYVPGEERYRREIADEIQREDEARMRRIESEFADIHRCAQEKSHRWRRDHQGDKRY